MVDNTEFFNSLGSQGDNTAFFESLGSVGEAPAPSIDPLAAIAQTGAALVTGGVLGTTGTIEGLSNAFLNNDLAEFDKSVSRHMEHAYEPTDPTAQKAVGAIGGAFQSGLEATGALLGEKARVATEAGLALTPFAKGIPKLRPGYKPPVNMKPVVVESALPKDVRRASTGVIASPELVLRRNLGAGAAGKMMKMEADIHRGQVIHEGSVTTKGNKQAFMGTMDDMYKGMEPPVQMMYKKAFADNDRMALRNIHYNMLDKKTAAALNQRLFKSMDDIKGDLGKLDKSFKPLHDYLPRVWKEMSKKDLAKLSTPVVRNLEIARDKYTKGSITREQYQKATAKAIMGHKSETAPIGTSHTKRRKVREIKDKHLDMLMDPVETLREYYHGTAQTIGESNFLGRNIKGEGVISGYMAEHGANLSPKKYAAVEQALTARFGPAARSAGSPMLSGLRDIGYIGTIADIASAATQLSDLSNTFGRQGAINTLVSLGKSAMPKKIRKKLNVIETQDMGVTDIMHEVADHKGGTKKWLDKAVAASAFKMMDQFGKRTLVNAAARRIKQAARKSPEKIRKDYKWMGKELPQFMEDLKTGNIHEPATQFAVFNELAQVQPNTLSQMPIQYLKHPNARILYSLKTWAIRQINMYREDALKGDYKKMAKTALSVYIGTNSIALAKDWLSATAKGDDLKPEEVSDRHLASLLQMMGMSKYQLGILERGDVWGALVGNMAPATAGIAGDVITGDVKGLVRALPVAGRAASTFMD